MISQLRIALPLLLALTCPLLAQNPGGTVSGRVTDREFEGGVPGARVVIAEIRGKETLTDAQGNYAIRDVPEGTYTITFAKDGYFRDTRTRQAVRSGAITEVDVALRNDFFELDPLTAEKPFSLDTGSEAGLEAFQLEAPALVDFIGKDQISAAGASDAADALRLVAGATVSANDTPVVRGLPDRFVSSSLNLVRLPSSDEETRAVQLDQFPSTVLSTILVSKTFTPDQQGDASGGAVNVVLRGIPNEKAFFKVSAQAGFNTNARGRDDFLSYDGGGVSFFGFDDGRRDPQDDLIGQSWLGAVGVTPGEAPEEYKWSLTTGGSGELENGLRLGGVATFFYERDASFRTNARDDEYWVTPQNPAAGLVPRTSQGSPSEGSFVTDLFDITQGAESVQWGSLLTFGLEYEDHSLDFLFYYSRITSDTASLAEDTRGKQAFFPGYDPNDPNSPGFDERDAAPYLRLETLAYEERITRSFQVRGTHVLPTPDVLIGDLFAFSQPELSWVASRNLASTNEPDRRQFGSQWLPARFRRGNQILGPRHSRFTPAENINLGNVQRIFEFVEEDGTQLSVDLEVPFKQWDGLDGFLKFGYFRDDVERTFDQNTYSNFGDTNVLLEGGFDQFLSANFPNEVHPIFASDADVDYEGQLEVRALYAMISLPVSEQLKFITGFRIESTDISIENTAESEATWIPPSTGLITVLGPGDADASISQTDALPSFGFEWKATPEWTFRGAYNETIAKQTFRELAPILQQEFVGGPIFIGNPFLEVASVKNYDLRGDWRPYPGGLISVSWFRKDITNPIEFVQADADFSFTTARNYPEGKLTGWEFEIRQDLGHFSRKLTGLKVGANATVINARVTLPDNERQNFLNSAFALDIEKRDMTNAPEFLYNLFVTYEIPDTGTKLGLFYTVQGDTLLSGAALPNNSFVPSIYAREFGTLNFSLQQRITDQVGLKFQAKNLTDPAIDTVFRSNFTGGDVLNSTFTRGIDISLSISADFKF